MKMDKKTIIDFLIRFIFCVIFVMVIDFVGIHNFFLRVLFAFVFVLLFDLFQKKVINKKR